MLLDAVIAYLPAPTDVAAINGIDSKTGDTMTCVSSDEAPFAALAFKIMIDPFVGTLTFARIYSGVITPGVMVGFYIVVFLCPFSCFRREAEDGYFNIVLFFDISLYYLPLCV